MIMKKCFKCNKKKSIDRFYRHSKMGDGHLGKCKECTKKDSTKHRNDNIEKIRFYDRERGNLPHRLKLQKRITKVYRKNFPERYAAIMLLNNAVRDGRITKNPCQVCGSTTRIHGHHEDYYKPLDVEWLCAKHHAKRRENL